MALHAGRRGLTLIELLAVIAIIGLLVGLLLPSVQSARESARRVTCQAKIRDIGLACQAYHASNEMFPPIQQHKFTNPANVNVQNDQPFPGGVIACDSSVGANQTQTTSLNFMTALFPYVDLQNVYDRLDMKARPPSNSPMYGYFAFVKCPTNPAQRTLGPCGQSFHYSGSTGTNGDHCTLPTGRDGLTAIAATNKPNGVFWANSGCRSAQIRDGLANTIMVCERQGYEPVSAIMGSSGFYQVYRVYGGTNCFQGTWLKVTPNNPVNWWYSNNMPVSLHPGGINLCMADGSVHFMSELVDTATWNNLARRADGQVVTIP